MTSQNLLVPQDQIQKMLMKVCDVIPSKKIEAKVSTTSFAQSVSQIIKLVFCLICVIFMEINNFNLLKRMSFKGNLIFTYSTCN